MEMVPAWSPEAVLRQAAEAGIVVRRENPLNGESPLPSLAACAAMPSEQFYRRNHFPIPRLDEAAFRLTVKGLVDRPLTLGMSELRSFPARDLVATLECAGNGRTLFRPAIEGERWDMGAVSTAKWAGTPLREVLQRAGVSSGAREVVFRGADGGPLDGLPAPIRFERSLPLAMAQNADVLLVHTMNGAPLTPAHGFPLRLVVPGWYAVASVKWLTEIELIDHEFEAFYQTDRYWYEWQRDGRRVREPVTQMLVRSLITEPAEGAEVAQGELVVRGVAWSGSSPLARVEVSAVGGAWHEARLVGANDRYGARRWEVALTVSAGPLVLRARAADEAGHTQPEQAEWNRLGYGNNSIHQVPIRVL
jgi:DMSO/TMAO reductase YedYZ molybdopterin-dependent catalytic subunit